jgi:hypothetical protein
VVAETGFHDTVMLLEDAAASEGFVPVTSKAIRILTFFHVVVYPIQGRDRVY